jgi:2-polyprenyl-3-methyl-5-hydroxy-6-metoxy-1,4-benzoquinol methylase
MALKDATHFNVQYIGSSPIFIDTLSFDKYEPSLPWVAYMQFCECFLYPLFIEHYTGMPVHKTLLAYPDGIPLSIVNSLLPFRSRFSFGVGLHVILPSKISRRQSGTKIPVKFNEQKMLRLLNNLHSIIFSLRPAQKKGVWGDYYERTVLKEGYLAEKERIFDEMLNKITFKKVLDIGANDGYFSKIIAKRAEQIIAIDSEYFCIDKLFRELKTDNKNILPLCIDFANPSPDTGFSGNERISFLRRGNYDLVIALAVMHHLVVAENIPLPLLARSLHTLTKHLIIEFVPLDDEKVDLIAANKQEIAAQLVKENFEDIFTRYFSIIDSVTVGYTKRIIYLMIVK